MPPEAENFRVTSHEHFRMSHYRVSENNRVVSIDGGGNGIGRFHLILRMPRCPLFEPSGRGRSSEDLVDFVVRKMTDEADQARYLPHR